MKAYNFLEFLGLMSPIAAGYDTVFPGPLDLQERGKLLDGTY